MNRDDRRVARSLEWRLGMVILGAVVGSLTALVPARGDSVVVACDKKACDSWDQFCFSTDLETNCSGGEGACSTEMCQTVPTKDCEDKTCDSEYKVCVPAGINSKCEEWTDPQTGLQCASSLCTE